MRNMYRPKNKNQQKLDEFIEKLERQGVFKEEVTSTNGKIRYIPGKSAGDSF